MLRRRPFLSVLVALAVLGALDILGSLTRVSNIQTLLLQGAGDSSLSLLDSNKLQAPWDETLEKNTSTASNRNTSTMIKETQGANTTGATETSTTAESSVSSPLVLDFLSIGSLSRPDFQEAQRSTFGNHPSIRFFFNVTEQDDAEPYCSSNLTLEDVFAISDTCRGKIWNKNSLMHYQRNEYARRTWLEGKKNPVGWLCAQKRPIHGLSKALEKYRAERLPDYLVIMDDDSYYQVELVQEELRRYISDDAHVVAGCLIRNRLADANFTLPFGGWGTILSRGAIFNLMRPVHCSQTHNQDDEFVSNACRRLEENQIGEKHLFREGMSVGELMQAYAVAEPFGAHASWSHGFCLHSDWALGFFFNFYFVGLHSGGRLDVSHDRMKGYLDSEMYVGRKTARIRAYFRQCKNNSPEHCSAESHICHYQTPESMKVLTATWKVPV